MKTKVAMKANRIKHLAALAATLVASSAWAALTYQQPGTTTFDSFQNESGYIWVGSTSGAFAGDDAWAIWCSSEVDGVYTNGINQTGTGSGFRIADGDGQTGKLKIESGNYVTGYNNVSPYAAFILGNGTGTGSYWQTGGTVTTAKYATRIGNGTGEVTFTMDGGEFNVGEWFLVGNGADSKATVTINGGALNTTTGGTFPVGYGARSDGKFIVDGGHVYVRNNLFIAGKEGSSNLTTAFPTGLVHIASGTMTNTAEIVLGRTTGGYDAELKITGGEVYHTGSFYIASCYGNGSSARMNVSNGSFASTATTVEIAQGWQKDATDATGTVEVSVGNGGSIRFSNTSSNMKICRNDGMTVDLDIDGGTFESMGDVWFGCENGEGSTVTMDISNGGVFSCGSATVGKWFKFGESGTMPRTINVNDGGTLAVCHFENYETGTTTLNLNGGTLKQLFTDSDNCKYIIGSNSHNDNSVTVTVTKDSTLDTSGKIVRIKNVVIGGAGTLRVVGGGTVIFETQPTCPVVADADTGIIRNVSSTTTPETVSLRANDFLEYDLTSITDDPGAVQTLASGVTITTTDGSAVAEHIIIKHGAEMTDHEFHWNVSYENSTLVATYEGDGTVAGNNATRGFTIYTGYEHSASTRPECWVNGYPTETTKMIVPFACELCLWEKNVHCGELVLHGDLTLSQQSKSTTRYKNFQPKSVSGEGSLFISFPDTYGYFESAIAGESATPVDVPVVITGTPRLTGKSEYPLNFNKSFTIDTGKTATLNWDSGANIVNFNGDLIVNGNLVTANRELTLQADITGSGTIDGSFTTAAGAKICATVTDATGASTYLTCTGDADLARAEIAVVGADSLASAEEGSEIILLKAKGQITWATKTVQLGDKPWRICTDTWTDATDPENPVEYNVLKAVKSHSGLCIIVK